MSVTKREHVLLADVFDSIAVTFSLTQTDSLHNAFRYCRVRFYASFGQPFPKQLYHVSISHRLCIQNAGLS